MNMKMAKPVRHDGTANSSLRHSAGYLRSALGQLRASFGPASELETRAPGHGDVTRDSRAHFDMVGDTGVPSETKLISQQRETVLHKCLHVGQSVCVQFGETFCNQYRSFSDLTLKAHIKIVTTNNGKEPKHDVLTSCEEVF